jgi:hypothetical protein
MLSHHSEINKHRFEDSQRSPAGGASGQTTIRQPTPFTERIRPR